MLAWLSSLRRSPSRPAAARAAAAPLPVPERGPGRVYADADIAVAAPAPLPAPSSFAWLLEGPPPHAGRPTADERALLGSIDDALAAPALPADLLPRAPSVVPQLMALLRQAQPSRAEMARHVLKDTVLTAEVLRLACSPFYGARAVDSLEAALDRVGTLGLQSAMSRVLLKPVFQAPPGSLSARAAPRLWLHAEHKSLHCAELFAREGGDRFEGFLAGLLHDTGWLALLRLLDRRQLAPALPTSLALDQALDRRKDMLFGRLTADWDLTPALTALSRHLGRSRRDAQSAPPLASALRAADLQCQASALQPIVTPVASAAAHSA